MPRACQSHFDCPLDASCASEIAKASNGKASETQHFEVPFQADAANIELLPPALACDIARDRRMVEELLPG